MYKNIEDKREWLRQYRKKHPEKVKEDNDRRNPINQPKRITFKCKRILLKKNPRTGVCSWCGKNGLTDLHHVNYHDEDPLKDTIELCKSCHAKETWRLRSQLQNIQDT